VRGVDLPEVEAEAGDDDIPRISLIDTLEALAIFLDLRNLARWLEDAFSD
jgi:hypothetical protein